MSDAEHYLKATLEIDDKLQEPALWAKAMALCEGNIKKSKYLYIKLRVEMLLADEKLVKVEESNIPDKNLESGIKPVEVMLTNDELVEVSQAEANEQDFKGALESKPKPLEYGGRVIYDSLEDKKKALRLKNETTGEKKRKKAIEGYITVDAYSKKSGIKPSQIISMVRGGSHEGQLVKGEWRVSPDDASTTNDKSNNLLKSETINQKSLKKVVEEYITVEAYSEKTGNKVAQVISKLEAGYLDGKLVNGGWLVGPDHTSMPRNETITSTIEINHPLNWCNFWIYGVLPFHFFGGIALLYYLPSGLKSSGYYLGSFFLLLAAGALVIGLHERRQWAWTLNGNYIVINSIIILISQSGTILNGAIEIITATIVHAIIWLWPNHVYWLKRKYIFNT